jgi:Cu/Ag efflux pump CusA
MSLGGIAIAVGAMVDAAVVMIENAHKHIEAWNHAHPGKQLKGMSIGASLATLLLRLDQHCSFRF